MVTVTDANGATTSCTVTISEPAALSASAAQDSPVACFGESNGAATVTVSGGNAPYSYSWDKSASASASAIDLAAGLHTITITDDKGCKTTATVTIAEPDVLSASATQDNPVVWCGKQWRCHSYCFQVEMILTLIHGTKALLLRLRLPIWLPVCIQ
ncbi:MAG: SprB repeat-containing protein [Draconibacterium sp.]|nr:SprB repeat-containing protein [Draconibacterium sp.]